MKSPIRVAAYAAAALVAGVTLSACSGETTDSSPTTAGDSVQASEEVVALLPEEVKSRGTLRVAVPDIGAPLGYQVNGELKGMDPALGEAVARTMGLEYEPEMVPFASTLPGLQADRYDLSYGEYYVTADRLKVVDFVSNWRDFSSFIVPDDGALKPESLDATCGEQVGAMDGSAELEMLKATQATCTESGKPEIAISAFPSISAGILALSSDRVAAVLIGRGTGENAIEKGQPLEMVGEIGGGITATAVARTGYSPQMLAALQKAYEVLIADGTYAKILEDNGTSYGAIDKPEIFVADTTPPVYQ